jgi:Flp pilus assembly protein TadD
MISPVSTVQLARLRFAIKSGLATRLASGVLIALILVSAGAQAADLHLKISKHTKPTPVQQLNQEGVKALAKNDTARAIRDFYKAYLLDPDDPFTLNNLGYVAELDGELDKAQKFYDLAATNSSSAAVEFSNNPELKGKQVSQVAGNAVSTPMQVNRFNVAAMGLMMKDRAPEAEIMLRKALALDSKNPFTLNNLGYALEKEGELEEAVRYYAMAAAGGSKEKVVVALNRNWRGRGISEIADLNVQAARRELGSENSTEAKVARLNLRGVSALNRNQQAQARRYFVEAFRIDPDNAFSLNNMGYISEVEGDRETADFYYAKARQANRSGVRIALATRKNLQGMRLASVADQNQQSVEVAQEKQIAALRAEGKSPLPLRTRDQAIVREPASPPTPEPETPVRILAEDNPPPEQPAVVASNQSAARNQQHGMAQPSPTPSQPLAAAQQEPPQEVTPLPSTKQEPQDETPLLPVIPDEIPAR